MTKGIIPHIHMMVWSDDPKEGFLTMGRDRGDALQADQCYLPG